MAAFDAGTSAAKRRRERRLRSWWRHERMSIAAVLASVSHHSYPQVDNKNDAPGGQKTVASTRVGLAEFYELSSGGGRPTGSERPVALLEPWPQGQVSWSRLSMLLCCMWWNSCQMFTISSPRVCWLLPSRLSTCPRSSSSTSPRDACVVSRSWRNSWKCRRSCLLRLSGCCRTLTLQFRMVVVELPEVQGFLPEQSAAAFGEADR